MSGPFPWLLGLNTLRQINRDQLGFYEQMQARHGDAVPLRLGPYKSWLLFHPDQIEAVLATQARSFVRFDKLMRVLRQWNGESLLVSEGESWHQRRRRVLPAFARKAMPGYETIFTQTAKDWTRKFVQQFDSTGKIQIDADEVFAKIALDMALRTLFGRTFSSQMDGVSAQTQVLSEVAFREATSVLTLPDWLPLKGKRTKARAIAAMRAFVRQIVENRLTASRNETPDNDLLAVLIETHHGEISAICDDAMSLMIAGHETSGAGLTWLFALLATHREALEKCQHEVRSGESIEDMSFLQAAIAETLRLYPPAYALFLRQATAPVDAAGVQLAKGDLALIIPYATGRDSRFFSDPEKFDPGRFLGTRDWSPYAYIPFGAGPRRCIGEQFAMREIAHVAAHFLRHFEPSLLGKFPGLNPQFSLRPLGGLPMNWTRI